MSKKIVTEEDTKHVAKLIEIDIPEAELASYTEQLNTALSSVDVLEELDTSDVTPSSQTHGLKNILREDEPISGMDMSKYQNDANFRDGYFVVKKVI